MQINLNKKKFYEKVVSYFKKRLLEISYKEDENDDYFHFAIVGNYGINLLSFWYYKKFDRIECQILDRIVSPNSTIYNYCYDKEIILYYLSVSKYISFDIMHFSILVKSKLI